MLKKKSKIKLGGAALLALLFCVGYVGIGWYSMPEKVSAVSWDPETRTIADIEYLQDMDKTICDNSKIGDANDSVKDSRDNNVYSIGKLADGKCWMTQNLRITRESIKAKDSSNTTGRITGGASGDTNLDSGYYEIPASTNSAFDASQDRGSHYTNQQVRAAANETYGAYYSYNVATLNKYVTQNSGSVTNDICPKGWKLPAGNTSSEFQLLYNKGNAKVGDFAASSLTSGYWLGGSANAVDAAFFPAAGYVYTSGLYYTGSEGGYWSSTIYSATYAYSLAFYSDGIYSAYNRTRYYGYSVRCVANDISEFTTSKTGSISVKVANTLSIDAVSGMEEEVDSTSVANGTITATIAANTNYKVLLSAEKTSLTSANSANDAEIPASTNVYAGTNAWGIRNSDNSTYSVITTEEKEYHNTTTPSTNPETPGTVHTFNIGISVSPSLPADTYSTEVTITAAAA